MTSKPSKTRPAQRRGVILIVIVLIMAFLALVVASTIRPVRDEAELATLRVQTTRAFYASESGAFVVMNAVLGATEMPTEGSTLQFQGEVVEFMQLPVNGSVAVIEGRSGDAVRRVEFTTE